MVRGIDLFAGAGGLTLGMKAAGVQTVCAVELEPHRLRTYAVHSPQADLIACDVREVSFAKYRGDVQLVYGGPPCQPFSSGGLRKADADDRNMVPEFVRAVSEVDPEAFVMENVPGLVAGDRMSYLAQTVERFTDLGFNVHWQVVNAVDFGVPQKRRRLFVVGMKNEDFRFPTPTHGPNRPNPFVRVKDVLSGEPLGELNTARVFYAKNPSLRPSPYDGQIYNGGGRPIDPEKPCHTILASAGGNKTHFFDPLGSANSYHEYLLSGGVPRVGTLPGARRITVAESALLQTFPSGMTFCGPKSAQYHQIGDAVPPLLAEAIGRAVVEQLRTGGDRPMQKRLTQKSLF